MGVKYYSNQWSKPKKKFLIWPRHIVKDGRYTEVSWTRVWWKTKIDEQFGFQYYKLAFLDEPDKWYEANLSI